MNSSTDPTQVFGYDVTDTNGNKVGKVDNVWVDDATNELEFIGVKTGWLMGKTHVIPVANAQIADGSVQVPFDQDLIKNAPSFGGDEELSPEQEQEIYGYYGEGRSTSESASGLPSGTQAGSFTNDRTNAYAADANYETSNSDDDQSVTLHEEELAVDKQQVSAGQVRLRKVIHTEHREVPVELRREEVEIERVPASGNINDDGAFQAQEVTVPLTREEAVVGTESRATEQVRLNKTVSTETENVGGDVRREDVETDDAGTTGYQAADQTKNRDSNY